MLGNTARKVGLIVTADAALLWREGTYRKFSGGLAIRTEPAISSDEEDSLDSLDD